MCDFYFTGFSEKYKCSENSTEESKTGVSAFLENLKKKDNKEVPPTAAKKESDENRNFSLHFIPYHMT